MAWEVFEVYDGVLEKYKGKDEDVRIPSIVKEIYPSALSCNPYIKKVIVPEGVTVIRKSAFLFSDNLEEVELPSTLTRIETCAFYGTGLKSIVLPESLQFIGRAIFDECRQLEEIVYTGTVEKFNTIEFENRYAAYRLTNTKTKMIQCADGIVDMKSQWN